MFICCFFIHCVFIHAGIFKSYTHTHTSGLVGGSFSKTSKQTKKIYLKKEKCIVQISIAKCFFSIQSPNNYYFQKDLTFLGGSFTLQLVQQESHWQKKANQKPSLVWGKIQHLNIKGFRVESLWLGALNVSSHAVSQTDLAALVQPPSQTQGQDIGTEPQHHYEMAEGM